MTPDLKLKLLRDLVIENLTFYDAPVNEMKVKMFAAELVEYDVEEVKRAFVHFRREKNRRQMPMPADIGTFLKPAIDPDALAQEAAARVIQAIGKFGWPNADQARAWVGELGWRAVERFGGWTYLCRSVGAEINQQMIFAQIRDLLKATIKLGATGHIDGPIQIEQGDRVPSGQLNSAKEVLRLIIAPKEEK